MKLLKISLEKKDKLLKERAMQIQSHMAALGKLWFSAADLRRLHTSDHDLQNEVFNLSKHGFLKEKKENDILYFSINLLNADRIKHIAANIETTKVLIERYKADLKKLKTDLANWNQIQSDSDNLIRLIDKPEEK